MAFCSAIRCRRSSAWRALSSSLVLRSASRFAFPSSRFFLASSSAASCLALSAACNRRQRLQSIRTLQRTHLLSSLLGILLGLFRFLSKLLHLLLILLLLVLLLLSRVALGLEFALVLELLQKLLLSPTGHTLPVGVEHALFEHARRKDGEHAPAFFHFLLFGKDLFTPPG